MQVLGFEITGLARESSMAGKRKSDDGPGRVTPTKRPVQEVEAAPRRTEEEDFPRGITSFLFCSNVGRCAVG